MGDVRFSHPLRRVQAAEDRPQAIRGLRDEEVVEALAGASREGDPYLANVLATEALNRFSRKTAIVESAAQGLLTVDLAGRVAYANPAAEAMAGTAPGGMKGRAAREFLRPDPPQPHEPPGDPLEAALAQGTTTGQRRGAFRSPEGAWRSVEWSVSPLLRHDEREGCVLTVTDVSARDRAEQELEAQREVQALLLQVQDDLQEGVLLLEGERVAHVNQAFLALVSCRRDQLHTFEDFLACIEPDERSSVRERLVSGMRAAPGPGNSDREVQRFELRLCRRDERRTDVEALLEHVRRGERVTTALVLRDVTLRRFVGEAVRASERELRAAFTHADAGLALLDAHGRWLRANEAACELLRTTAGHLRAQRWADAFAPTQREPLDAAFHRCLDAGAATVEADPRVPDGEPLALRLRRARGDTGAPAYVVVLLERAPPNPLAESTASAAWHGVVPHQPAA